MPYDAPIASLDIREPMSREAALEILSDHTRGEIDHWRAKYPEERRRSAVSAALREAQHQNEGLFDPGSHGCRCRLPGTAEYLRVRGGELLFHVRNKARGAAQRFRLHEYFLHAARRSEQTSWGMSRRKLGINPRGEHPTTAEVFPEARRGVPGGMHRCADDDGGPQMYYEKLTSQ